ncbi:chloramphenicol phosphotransferase CPT family protein, partial [Streptomyces caniscabiei]|uniref:chloramphenicol phosphotransferase CPT family protein n=1 Tax=Streptomyces caniscabiei TaxID=2746961 RepID=UPI001C501F08
SDGSGAPLDVLWVGVRCAPDVAAAQADLVHRGVHYDLEVDTTHTESLTCARTIATHLR